MRLACTFAGAACAFLLAGCATYESESMAMRSHWSAGNYLAAGGEAAAMAEDRGGSGDAVVCFLESGAAARAAGSISASIDAFQKAYDKIIEYEDGPEVSLTDESGALLTNQSYLPYRGYSYDKIMLCAYQAMNHMEAGKLEESAVWLRRLQNFQESAVRENRDRIEREAAEIEAANSGKNSYDTARALRDPRLSSRLRQIYGDAYMPDAGLKAGGAYANPFGYWLCGVFFLNAAASAGDVNMAADFFRFAFESSGAVSPSVLEDAAAAEKLAGSGSLKPDPVTYVVYETGCAPIRRQTRIDIPLFLATKDVPYVGAAFPYLQMQNSFAPPLSVRASNAPQRLDAIADMDAVIKREFDADLPSVVSKTLVSAGVKAGIQYGLYQAARSADNGAVSAIAIIAGSLYQAAMNDADLRTWTTLPKRIFVARFPTPKDGGVSLDSSLFKVAPGKSNIIFAKRTGPGSLLSARVFTFN